MSINNDDSKKLVYAEFAWLQRSFPINSVRSVQTKRGSESFLYRKAGHSSQKCAEYSSRKRRMVHRYCWSREIWLMDKDGRLVAQVHPKWWYPFCHSRTIYEVMSKMGASINNVAFIVEVEHYLDFDKLCLRKPMEGTTFAQLFHEAVARDVATRAENNLKKK